MEIYKYTMQGNENRREMLLEIIEKIDKPSDLNTAVCEELEKISVTLSQIEAGRI